MGDMHRYACPREMTEGARIRHYGAVLEVLTAPRKSTSHPGDDHGGCYLCEARVIQGSAFEPLLSTGRAWTFQGNDLARFMLDD